MTDNLSPGKASLLGLFVVVAISLATAGVFAIGHHDYWGLRPTFGLKAEFSTIGGVTEGTRVRVQGMDAGVVERIESPTVPGRAVVVHLRLDHRYRGLIREDAIATLATQGIVGNRVVEIQPGSEYAAAIEPGATLRSDPPVELNQLLAEAYSTGKEVRELGHKLGNILGRLDHLTARVEEGEGSLGKFVMTNEAHQSALNLMNSGDELVDTMGETLVAMRRVWPLKDYFMKNTTNDPDHLLYRPGSRHAAESFDTDLIFEAGRSVIHDAGKQRLDQLASWVLEKATNESEIMVAAFDQLEPNATKAQKLTQEQAQAARDYLVEEHSIHRVGFFGSREVIAAGFGSNRPDDQSPGASPRRLEVIIYTPAK